MVIKGDTGSLDCGLCDKGGLSKLLISGFRNKDLGLRV